MVLDEGSDKIILLAPLDTCTWWFTFDCQFNKRSYILLKYYGLMC